MALDLGRICVLNYIEYKVVNELELIQNRRNYLYVLKCTYTHDTIPFIEGHNLKNILNLR